MNDPDSNDKPTAPAAAGKVSKPRKRAPKKSPAAIAPAPAGSDTNADTAAANASSAGSALQRAAADTPAAKPAAKRPRRKNRSKSRSGDPATPDADRPRPVATGPQPDPTGPSADAAQTEPSRVEPAAPLPAPASTSAQRPAQRPVPVPAAERRPLLTTRLDVRWGDMDAFNHVNNAVFLSYLEEARLRWLQGLPGPWLDDNTAPLLAAAHVDYRRPIEWPCTLAIELYADRAGNTSVTLGHRIIDASDNAVVFSEGHTVMVWIDRRNGKPSALPASVRRACDATD